MEKSEVAIQSQVFPPVVSVLGHVDHGKTTLLDKIRTSTIASREAGGITQSIGASSIEITHDGKKRLITFIDTPGHEAFSNMRSHGVSAADIVLLVVAADDGIKPQTKESIALILASKLPFIAVITKTDAPGAQIEKVKQQLLQEGVLLEGLGGDVPFIGVSAKTGDKIQELLDLIVIVYDLSDIKKDAAALFTGVVIESKHDKRKGALVSLVVKNGTFHVGDKLYIDGQEYGKAKAILDATGKQVKEALPGDGVEILGSTEVLPAGTVLISSPVALAAVPEKAVAAYTHGDLLEILHQQKQEKLPIILKTSTSGEYEAIAAALPEDVTVIFEGRGDIGASDVLMARDFNAIIVGFNVDIEKQAKVLADTSKTFYRNYKIIYELLDELEAASNLLKERAMRKILGKAQILQIFEGNEGKILGVRIIEGRLSVGDNIVITRGENETEMTKIASLKQGKKDAKEVGKGTECGVMIDPLVDFTIGDMILSVTIPKQG